MKTLLSLVSITLVCCGPMADSGASAIGPTVRELPADNFKQFISQPGALNVVSFYAPWCKPCQMVEPNLKASVRASPSVVRLGTVNVENAIGLLDSEKVKGIPDVRFYVNGVMVDKFRGAVDRSRIDKIIAKHQNVSP